MRCNGHRGNLISEIGKTIRRKVLGFHKKSTEKNTGDSGRETRYYSSLCLLRLSVLIGERHGYGIELQIDGSYFEGEWHTGDRKGRGIYQSLFEYFNRSIGKVSTPTGSVVIGEWAGNKISSSVFHKGKFDDVPRFQIHSFFDSIDCRPLRIIFEQDVVKKPCKDSSVFLTSKKWTGTTHSSCRTVLTPLKVSLNRLHIAKIFLWTLPQYNTPSGTRGRKRETECFTNLTQGRKEF